MMEKKTEPKKDKSPKVGTVTLTRFELFEKFKELKSKVYDTILKNDEKGFQEFTKKFYVQGDLTRNEFIKVGKFFRNMFKDTTKVINIMITEGLEHTSKEDTAKLMSEIFKDSKDYTIITIEKKLGGF
jgi:hypothetical protein